MRKAAVVILLMLLAGIATGCISSPSGPSSTTNPDYVTINGTKIYLNEIHFYMYGLKTCPHCQHMHDLIPETYGEDSLTYYELLDNEENMQLFRELNKLTGIQGVPAIAITYKGNISAVFEGEFNVSAVPEIIYEAMKSNGTLLFVGGKGYLLPHGDPKAEGLIEKLYTIFVEHKLPAEGS
jgi:glutaredoxin